MIVIGVLALQGGVAEHIYATKKAAEQLGLTVKVVPVKRANEIENIDAIILPGGESTTIGKLAARTGLLKILKKRVELDKIPVLGTCAGAIMLAKRVKDAVKGDISQPLLGVMNVQAIRNYFGRQKHSFEVDLRIPVLGDKPFRAVFIRAPVFDKVWGNAEVLAELNGLAVYVKEGSMHATAFHPELTNDTRIHQLFLKEIKK